MNINHYKNDIKAALSIVALVLCGGLIFGGGVFVWHTYDVSAVRGGYASEMDKMRKDRNESEERARTEKSDELAKRDQRIDSLSNQVTHLTLIIEQRLPLIVDQTSENVEKLDKLSGQVGAAVTQSKRAAATASRAASQAGQVVKKVREPAGTIRLVPTKRTRPACINGKDLYDEPC